jgi:hypothetical protein
MLDDGHRRREWTQEALCVKARARDVERHRFAFFSVFGAIASRYARPRGEIS